MQGLRDRGLTPFHRTAYAPVKAFLLQPISLDDLISQLDDATVLAAEQQLDPAPALA